MAKRGRKTGSIRPATEKSTGPVRSPLKGTLADSLPTVYESLAGMPEPPKYLKTDALEMWREVAPLLYSKGLLSPLDRHQLGLYCSAYGELTRARRELEESGPHIQGVSGSSKTSPWVGIAVQARKEMITLGSDFGMRPANRAGVAMQESPVVDRLTEAIAKRGKEK